MNHFSAIVAGHHRETICLEHTDLPFCKNAHKGHLNARWLVLLYILTHKFTKKLWKEKIILPILTDNNIIRCSTILNQHRQMTYCHLHIKPKCHDLKVWHAVCCLSYGDGVKVEKTKARESNTTIHHQRRKPHDDKQIFSTTVTNTKLQPR